MDAMSHVTWIPHPQELVKLHVYFTKTSLTKELYVENKSLHQLTQDPSETFTQDLTAVVDFFSMFAHKVVLLL